MVARIDRAKRLKLLGFAGLSGVAGAAAVFAGAPVAAGGIAVAAIGKCAEQLVPNIGAQLLLDAADDAAMDAAARAKGTQNRHIHKLLGEAIARVLAREAAARPDGDYLESAAEAFRSPSWMQVALTGAEAAIGEPAATGWFTGRPEDIKAQPVLTADEWMALVERVAGAPPALEGNRSLQHAAYALRHGFAAEVWEAAKEAGTKGDITWHALLLRLLSEIHGQSTHAAESSAQVAAENPSLRREIQQLATEVRSSAERRAQAPEGLSDADRLMFGALDEHYRDIVTALDALVPAVQSVKVSVDEMLPIVQKTFELVARQPSYAPAVAAASSGNLRRPNPTFVGRADELRRLDAAMASGRIGVVTALHGLGASARPSWR